ncbi:MAG TPA: cytochrome c [Gemmataceae bacterium]|nr:cytochrome c [Gemmataceae bacterium]
MIRLRLTPRVRAIAASLAVLTLAACQQRMAHPPYYRPLTETDFYPDRRSSRPLEEGTVHRAQILDSDPLASGLSAAGKVSQTVSILNDDGTPKEIKTGPGIPNKIDNFVAVFPFQVTGDDLKRGKERFQVFCVPCHGTAGNGRGKIVERGFLEPTSFHLKPVDADEAAFRDRQLRENPDRIPLGMSRGFAFYKDPASATGANFRLPLRDVPVGYLFEVISKGFGGMPDYASQIPVLDRWRIAAYVRTLQLSQAIDPAKLTPEQKAEMDKALGGQK